MQSKSIVSLMLVGSLAIVVGGCSKKAKARVKQGEMSQTMDIESIKKNYLEGSLRRCQIIGAALANSTS